ncbi:MAG TPA: YkvA family protein [Thermoleophilaceae bacterium]
MTWLWLALAAGVVAWLLFVLVLYAAGRREDARALAGFIPDCVVLFKRLSTDSGVPRRRRVLLLGLIAYLAMPFDLVPDFIPVAGQLDDAILVALVLRGMMRGAGPSVVREHWPGPERSLNAVMRLAGGYR